MCNNKFNKGKNCNIKKLELCTASENSQHDDTRLNTNQRHIIQYDIELCNNFYIFTKISYS